jgi:hypothetical protein
VGLIVREDLADILDRPLHLVDVPGFLLLHHQRRTDDLGVTAMYRRRVLPGSSEARTDSLVMSVLSSSSAFYISSVQQKESDPFSSLYRGSPLSPS